MMGTIRLVLIAAVLAYLAIVLFMYVQQRSIQYLPSRAGTSPQAAGLSGVSEERLVTPDGETIVLWHAEPRPGMPTILFFHGNGGELADRVGRMSYYQSRGFGALFVSYRGYGASTGSPTEQGLMADALAAYGFLLARGVTPENIAVVGESLGTGVAVQLAAQKPVAAVALEAPFTAAADAGADMYWWLPVRLLMKDQFRSRDHIVAVKAPLLIQHGERDRVIPAAQGKALFALAKEPKELVIIPDVGHDMIAIPDVWAREVDFFLARMKKQ
ncbi:MAG: alpha/beta hydrolase [Aestuariivirga sp.]|uniref:alpha/beta hydrolase n=1 Tax=Aestuariivirga sp. TaxID=2650926 RepID=UPI0038D1B1D8